MHIFEPYEALLRAGYPEVANVQGGFSGTRDLAGRKVARGWFALGLPVEYGAEEGQSYESLVESMERSHKEGASAGIWINPSKKRISSLV